MQRAQNHFVLCKAMRVVLCKARALSLMLRIAQSPHVDAHCTQPDCLPQWAVSSQAAPVKFHPFANAAGSSLRAAWQPTCSSRSSRGEGLVTPACPCSSSRCSAGRPSSSCSSKAVQAQQRALAQCLTGHKHRQGAQHCTARCAIWPSALGRACHPLACCASRRALLWCSRAELHAAQRQQRHSNARAVTAASRSCRYHNKRGLALRQESGTCLLLHARPRQCAAR